MKKTYILPILFLFAFGCKKFTKAPDDAKGKLHLRGRLFYADTISKAGPITGLPLASKIINIGYAKDAPDNFIYSTTTDTDGYFTFTNLNSDSTYQVFGRNTENGILFYNSQPVKLTDSKDDFQLTLLPSQTEQNGFIFRVTDTGTPGNPVNNCSVCLFLSKLQYQADTCLGAAYALNTNVLGIAYQVNVPPGRYYGLFKASLGKKVLTAHDSIDVKATGIVRKAPVVLK